MLENFPAVAFTTPRMTRPLASVREERDASAIDHEEMPFHALADFAPIGILQSNPDGSIVYANLTWQEISGLTKEQSSKNGWIECVHPDDRAEVFDQWHRAIQTLQEFELAYRIIKLDGEIRHVHTRARRIAPGQPRCIGYIICVEDVTEYRRIEQERCEHSEILERSLNEIYIFDADTLRFEFVNEGARRNLGYDMNELREMTPVDIKPLFDHTQFELAIMPLRTGEEKFLVFETVHCRADGTQYDVEVRLQMSGDANRRVFLAIILDITERLALESVNEQRNALQRAILDRAAYPIVAMSADGSITRFNLAAEELLGYSSDEVVSQCTPLSFHLESEVRDRAIALSNELEIPVETGFDVLTIKSQHNLPNEHEWTYVRKDGSTVPVLLCITTLEDKKGEIIGYIGVAKDITSQKLAETRLENAAVTDQLTGLPNRTFILNRIQRSLERAIHQDTHFSVLFLDFDRFKSVNDSLGHCAGDQLLKQIANRLRNNLHPQNAFRATASSVIARLGGDEFVILLDDLKQPEDALKYADSLHEVLAEPYQLGKHQLFSSASIGLVVGPSNYLSADDIVRDADTAMYEAKRAGRSRYVVFDNEMHTKVQRGLQIESDLRAAIGTSQLSLHYQLIASLLTGEITGVEALIRWQHPTLGAISPGEFIPIANETDLIISVGNWVIGEACRQFSKWQRELTFEAPPLVSINLARKQFADPNLVGTIKQALSQTGMHPRCLQVEITEDAFAVDMKAAVRTMNSIKEQGINLAIDDFGSGTSSFVALHQFPVDVLKVDRSLIKNIEHSSGEAALLHALVVMARNLGMGLVAEGIESASQMLAVQQLGCEYMQGFYYAKPMSSKDLTCFLRRESMVDVEIRRKSWLGDETRNSIFRNA